MKNQILKLFSVIETAPISIRSFLITFLAIIIARVTIERAIDGMRIISLPSFLFPSVHYFLEFLTLVLIALPVIRWAGARSLKYAANISLVALLIIFIAPIIDYLVLNTPRPFSIYEFGSLVELVRNYFTFFDDTPDFGITYGIRIEVAVAIIGIFFYSLLRTANWLKAFGGAVALYTIFYVISTFPSWVSLFLFFPEKSPFSVSAFDAVGLFLSPKELFSHEWRSIVDVIHIKVSLVYAVLVTALLGYAFWKNAPGYFVNLFKDVRAAKVIGQVVLFLLGGISAMIFSGARPTFDFFESISVFVLAIAVVSALIASVITENIADSRYISKADPSRPLPAGVIPETLYAEIGVLFFFISILFPAIISFKLALLLLVYQAVSWLYLMPPLRLKRVPVVSQALQLSLWILVFLVGYLLLV